MGTQHEGYVTGRVGGADAVVQAKENSEMSSSVDDSAIEYDAESGTYRTFYDLDTHTPSLRLLEAVAAIQNADPTDLDPLDDYVDPDALNAIFEPIQSRPEAHGSLSFDYEGLLVLVHSDGEIELRERA